MPAASGVRLGPYEVTSLLGSGGMGEVYRARDTKLNRDVALKVLPDAFTLDPERLARFKREAQVLAALNHPNIGAIYGFEESTHNALVLELVEGPTLADRLAAGPLPLDEALPIATQLVDALEAAHEQGIIHRDLKPANIKLRPDGTVKVLDFGLAKALAPNPAGADAGGQTYSPTITSPAMTQAGVILGTAAYMAPEQAKGKAVDKRSDVWAFGAVLFEMLTGRRAFDGEDMTDTLGAVVRLEPKWDALPTDVPTAVRTLIQRCLVKDRRQRVADMSTARFVLGELHALHAPVAHTAAARTRWGAAIPAAAAALTTAFIVGTAAWLLRPAPAKPIVSQFSFRLPDGQAFSGTSRQFVAISPDGTRVAYVANSRIYVRTIGELEPRMIPGSETGQTIVNPVFASDGESIAFTELSSGVTTLKRVAVSGGTPSTVATMAWPDPSGATWGPDGIVIAGRRHGIFRVSPTGGVLERIVGVGDNETVHSPQMLPDGRTLLFTVAPFEPDATMDQAQVVVQSVPGGMRRVLIDGGSDARYVPSGHLLYAVGGTLFAVPFDARRLAVTGAAVPVIVGVSRSRNPPRGTTQFATEVAVSDTGTLAYVPGPAATTAPLFHLVVSDARGDVPLGIPAATFAHPRVSLDGRLLAVQRDEGQNSDIWTYDLAGTSEIRRLTFGGNNRFPVWSGDSRRITFQSGRESDRGIFWHAADGTGAVERLTQPAAGEEHVPESWSRDGRRLLFSVMKGSRSARGDGRLSSLWVLTLDSKKTEQFTRAESVEQFNSSFSPDGRWVAYQFTDSFGPSAPNRGVFIEPFPATGERHQAPRTQTDYHAAWSPDGKSLFYVPTAGRPILKVPITTTPAVAFGTPVEPVRAPRTDIRSDDVRGYDVLPDGRFITLSRVYSDGSTAALSGEIRVVINWLDELKRRVPRQ